MVEKDNKLELPLRLNGDGTIAFLKVTRQELSEQPFLDQRLVDNLEQSTYKADLNQDNAHKPETNTPLFIFHTAFCCSTLMARALDTPGRTLVLKEPMILEDFTNAGRRGEALGKNGAALNSIMSLLSQMTVGKEALIIKPTNAINRLAPILMQQFPNARALVMHSGLSRYLFSLIKKEEEGRAYARRQLVIARFDNALLHNLNTDHLARMTDLQVAALAWLAMAGPLHEVLKNFPDRAKSLDSDLFLQKPEKAMKALNDFANIGFSEKELKEIARSPVFKKHAKYKGEDYDRSIREKEAKILKDSHGAVVKDISSWAKSQPLDIPVGAFTNPLF